MRYLPILLLLALPLTSQAKKTKDRNPNSLLGTICMNVKSLDIANGHYLVNGEIDLQYGTPMGLTLGLQTLTTALASNQSNDLCIRAEQSSLNAKKIRADWPNLSLKPR